ncbi:MAG TPA: SCP2 sterol-binding domain-containing protein [Candidatus Polarisedimenticolaceae bacterium]|nr:SCP2 sterol-binding domain-containing protein [Candidatus Polarisedimenticolaceae bacterium]
MAIAFGSPAWAEALHAEINRSSEYRNAAAKWGDGFNGNVLLVFEPDPAMPRRQALLVELTKGTCHGASFVDADDPRAGFALRAPFSVWKDILDRKTLAATAILTGKLRVDGDKMTLLKHTAAHRSLITCAAALDTEYPAA